MSTAKKRIELAEIREQIIKKESTIEELFTGSLARFNIPDRLPPDWGQRKIKLNISFDQLDYDNIKNLAEKLRVVVYEHSELRRRETALMMEEGIEEIKEVAPE